MTLIPNCSYRACTSVAVFDQSPLSVYSLIVQEILICFDYNAIPHKNHETAHMKKRLCLPSPLQSNFGYDKVQILLNSRFFQLPTLLAGGDGER